MFYMKLMAATVALCAGLAVAGCGGGSDPSPGATAAAGSDATVANAEGPGPPIRLPAGEPPKKLVVRNLRRGSGTEAKVGYDATIRYVGVHWTGEIYSNSWTYEKPPSFVLGARELTMRGLDEGIRGMRVGGRREIIIPPSFRFEPGEPGAKRRRASPEETLVYIVDLIKARPAFDKFRALKNLE